MGCERYPMFINRIQRCWAYPLRESKDIAETWIMKYLEWLQGYIAAFQLGHFSAEMDSLWICYRHPAEQRRFNWATS